MSIRRLRTLLAIAERGTFAAAATDVHVSQAAVSMQMKALEGELGVVLFDRSRRPPVLTASAHALLPKAREIVGGYDALVRSVRDGGGPTGELTIGAVPTTMTGLVPKAISALRTSYPELHVRVVPALSAELMAQVERGQLDAAIVSEPPYASARVEWSAFAAEPLVVVAAEDAVATTPEALLAEHPFIRFNRQAWVGRLIDEWLQKSGIQVREAMELDTLEAITTMVFHGLGVSIVPLTSVPSPNPLALKRVPLGSSARPRLLGVVVRRDCPKRRLIDLFREELVEAVRDAGRATLIGPGISEEFQKI